MPLINIYLNLNLAVDVFESYHCLLKTQPIPSLLELFAWSLSEDDLPMQRSVYKMG